MPSPQPSSNPSLSLPQPLRSERSGRDTPASVDSIPLEWDHDYDLSRDLESASRTLPSEDEEGEEDKEFYLRGAVGLSDIVIPENPEAYVKLTENAIRNTSGRHKDWERTSHTRRLTTTTPSQLSFLASHSFGMPRHSLLLFLLH